MSTYKDGYDRGYRGAVNNRNEIASAIGRTESKEEKESRQRGHEDGQRDRASDDRKKQS